MEPKPKKLKVYAVLSFLFGWIVRLLYRVRLTGKENIPSTGGCMFCANHQSLIDVPAMIVVFPRQIRFLAKAELFSSAVGRRFFGAFGAISVRRGDNDVQAIRRVLGSINEGNAVAVFPQGTRHAGENPADTVIKSGVGLIAYRSAAPVIPVCIRAKGQRLRPFRKTEILVGKPILPEEFRFSRGGSEEYAYASRVIFSHICALGGFTPSESPAETENQTTEKE